MARLVNVRDETNIYQAVNESIHNRLGNFYSGQDSTINIVSEVLSKEIINLKRENERLFEAMQLSNATNEDLDSIAFDMYGLNRLAATFAKVAYEENNLHFYVESGSFGDINGGVSITLPAGTLVSVENSFLDNTIIYQLVETYVLDATVNYAYCSAIALNPGEKFNVSEHSLEYHDFTNYQDVINNSLKVTNKYPVINGRDEESDLSLRYRVSNYMLSNINKNEDALLLKSLEIPGIREVRIIQGYFGIGTTGVIAFGQGREMTRSIIDLLELRLTELNLPGQNITVVNGITVYFDFKVRVYIKSGINDLEKENIKSLIKRDIVNIIKENELINFLDLNTISRVINKNFITDKIIGFGKSETGSSIFEEVFIRKTDRFDFFPEEKIPLLESFYRVNDDERISFGEVVIELEEDPR
jgi:uncharacterized phage protein gp47/JayE